MMILFKYNLWALKFYKIFSNYLRDSQVLHILNESDDPLISSRISNNNI